MKISETLCLDHFYVNVSENQFEELKTLEKYLVGFSYDVVKVTDDSWEGSYLSTNAGEYIEFFPNGKRYTNSLGIAFSSKSNIYADSRDLKDEFKSLDWQRGSRIWQNGAPWFDWLSLNKNTKDYFKTWSMFYHPNYKRYENIPSSFNKPNSIARIVELSLYANSKVEDLIRFHLQWTGAEVFKTNSGIVLSMKNREFECFKILVEFKDGIEGFHLRNVVLETHRFRKPKLPSFKSMKIIQKRGVIKLDFEKKSFWGF